MIRALRSAFRQLRHAPGFALTGILTLALGIGASTAMYSILYAVVLQPLPFSQPAALVALSDTPWGYLSVPTLQDWASRSRSFRSIAAYTDWSPRVESSAGVGHANPILVSQNFFATLGTGLALGHDFAQTARETDCLRQVIVSDAYWRRMGGGNSLSGRTIQLDRHPYAVIGVLSARDAIEGQGALAEPSIFTPIGCDPGKMPQDRGDSAFEGIGRLRPGISLRAASADLIAVQRTLTHEFANQYPPSFAPALLPLADAMAGTGTRSALLATLAACGMLLLIACANLVNLLLARNTRRRAEFSIRATLGATPARLMRQMLVENSVLAALGALTGIALAAVIVHAVRDVTAFHLARLAQAHLDLPAFLFAAAISVGVALLLTLLPAARSLRPRLLTDLAGAGRSASSFTSLRRAGRILVALQLAVALVLVACAGWMIASVLILLHQPLGFEPGRLIVASTDLRGPVPQPTQAAAQTLAILNQAMTRLRALPGVEAVAAANDKPLGGRTNRYTFCTDVHPEACNEPGSANPDVFLTTPGYFRTLGQRLARGRDFNAADDGRNHVAIVNHALAAREWPGQDPVGRRIYTDDLHAWATVVGEVGDVHNYSLERAPVPNLYLPEEDGPDTSITIMVRTRRDPALLEETVRRTLSRDSQISLHYVETMPELMAHAVALRRFSMWVAACFGLLSLVIATVGTYGLLSYEVSLREREIGIRLALGSPREAIVRLLLRQESLWILSGATLGLGGAAAVGFLLRSQFYGTRAASAPVLTASALLLVLPALLAVSIPARRASRLDPAQTLRRE